jgi:hypothetical protein
MHVFATTKTRTAFLLLFIAAEYSALARGPVTNKGTRLLTPGHAAKASACFPATYSIELDLNNVRARIETGGNMWQDRSLGAPAYEIPRTPDRSGPDAIFAGSLWLGGIGAGNNLKLAAVQFRARGNDFWPGPLSDFVPGGDNDASTNSTVCSQYDRAWKTRRQDALRHEAYYRCVLDPDCEESIEYPGYTIPTSFLEWPAHGDAGERQDHYLAPFGEFDPDGEYNPAQGDYPGYELGDLTDNCRLRDREKPVPLFGDENIWWVFNDKGSAHTESGGQPIGMEIRAQAFAFSTNDEVNNMTFYNYTLINQGSQTLANTYFGQWVDVDLGGAGDDFVGCDVQRGLGYAYNGDDQDDDDNGIPGYGAQPPAVGVDFFEGPYVDNDQMDNPLTSDLSAALDSGGIVYPGIGIGYGDGVPDNERLGMRAFVYHNNGTSGANSDPQGTPDYYNYLRAYWRDGTPMTYCGTGYAPNDPDAVLTRYMFPGDSDPLNWATRGIAPACQWTEEAAGNQPEDRRFLQSAGPFKLDPGAQNNITVGVVWARAAGGGPYASVELVRQADDKAQSLFDNCFRILDGPVAPELVVQELDQELILYVKNSAPSNNVNEGYEKEDPTIPPTAADRKYRFQGYQIYQVKDATVSASELRNVDRARLLVQCDIEDGVSHLVNYEVDPVMGVPVPMEMVHAENKGVKHAFRVTEDLFASSAPGLVNFRTYHYMAIAYAHNNWQQYDATARSGQARPYLASRRGVGGSIRSYSGIPHSPLPEAEGTLLQCAFGDALPITRLEGQGQSQLPLSFTATTEQAIVREAPWRVDELHYATGRGPIDVHVVDPLRVPQADLELYFRDPTPTDLDEARWTLVNLTTGDSVTSDRTIAVANEQLILQWGLAVNIGQDYADTVEVELDGTLGAEQRIDQWPIEATLQFADPAKAWLGGVPDVDGEGPFNWIRSGTSFAALPDTTPNDDRGGVDPDERYEKLLGGTWAPWVLCGYQEFQPGTHKAQYGLLGYTDLRDLPSVRIVISPDKELWSRSPVFEMQQNPALVEDVKKLDLRNDASVNKDGQPDGSGTGFGWFPGYAVDLNTGERLNIGFGEDSFWGGTIGRDMRWNPDARLTTDLGAPLIGGQHWIFVFRNARRMDASANAMPQYDEGAYIAQNMAGGIAPKLRVWRSIAWVGSAMLVPDHELLETTATIELNVERPYQRYVQPYAGYTPAIAPLRNNGLPLYAFSTRGDATLTAQPAVAESALDMVNIVPNPYYAFSGYETSRLDNRVKFTNLPRTCTISIYSVSGALIRKYRKDNDLTYLDWDLRNNYQVPIAGGTYICHIDAPGIGERVLKWFGVIRPVDLQNF